MYIGELIQTFFSLGRPTDSLGRSIGIINFHSAPCYFLQHLLSSRKTKYPTLWSLHEEQVRKTRSQEGIPEEYHCFLTHFFFFFDFD